MGFSLLQFFPLLCNLCTFSQVFVHTVFCIHLSVSRVSVLAFSFHIYVLSPGFFDLLVFSHRAFVLLIGFSPSGSSWGFHLLFPLVLHFYEATVQSFNSFACTLLLMTILVFHSVCCALFFDPHLCVYKTFILHFLLLFSFSRRALLPNSFFSNFLSHEESVRDHLLYSYSMPHSIAIVIHVSGHGTICI